ncbi:SRPBCC family protein [Undibacterium flavidum]|uniref:SRPBCC domain-containing protein n=1 Tax=Undibacterium flavidum TaxID=2762297 RepID=A0ABR6YF45_9BURK|nr:SRPBCC domain-containing protein [Undibacterium flavidum]MBC3875189.1 SRPBCC domain-containing protein [Undibacterium flavidum]
MTATANVPSITVKRKIAAPAQQVFEAWLNPEFLAQWMRPCSSSTQLSDIKVDACVGGAFEIIMHVASGPVPHTGVYQIIDAPRQLVFTWNSPHAGNHDSLVTVDFYAEGDATEVVVTHERLPEAARNGHIGGWTEILESLAQKINT